MNARHNLLALIGVLSAAATVAAGTIETVVGTGVDKPGPASGPATQVQIGNPFGVEVAPDGSLIVCEVSHHRVRRLDRSTGEITTLAGTGKLGYSGDGGPATDALLNEPYEVRFDRQGNLYFVEMQNHLVRRVDAKTGVISTVAGTGQPGFSGDGGNATKAQLRIPHSIALDDQGWLYIADIGNHRVRAVNLADGTIQTIAGTGEKSLPVDGQPATDRPILGPRALFVDGRTLWIALREGNSVWRMDLDSRVLHHVSGTGKKGYSGDGGPARDATFNGPKGIALGPQGDIYVADTENHVIRRIDASTGIITTVAGDGTQGGTGDGGPATQAKLKRPHGVCLDLNGILYIGDSENHRVRRVTP